MLSDTTNKFMGWVEAAGPKLGMAVLILVAGWLAAKVVKMGLVKSLRLVKLDMVAEKAGIEDFLRRGNIQGDAVEILGSLVYWVMLLLILLLAVNALGLGDAGAVIAGVGLYIPRVILAVVILILGLSLAGFMADVVQTAAVNAELTQARMLANVTRYTITIVVFIVALNQLEVDTEFLSKAFLILFAALCFALALAFGLGCKDLAGEIARSAWESEQRTSKAIERAVTDVAETDEAGAAGA